ncbi:hypothetical protein [Xanthomonas bonasiae]|uniref:hypothetical protein n=1 Tax=Xanthomonas bonasiae TaxID=2810351 RepID=UPI00197E1050|nr:hypothetical protein [Xanthomonas bonasiae]MBN6113242.1 hypothetical protein [Xanthomonas bonasiae]
MRDLILPWPRPPASSPACGIDGQPQHVPHPAGDTGIDRHANANDVAGIAYTADDWKSR